MTENFNLQINHKIIRFLEETKAQCEKVLDQLPGLIAFVDVTGKIYRGNSRLASLLGVDFEDLSGCNCISLLPKESHKNFFHLLKKSAEYVETGVNAEINIIDRENNVFNFVINVRPNIDQDYGPLGVNLFYIVGNDITEIKTLIEKNSRMENELQTAKAVQDNLFPGPLDDYQSKMSLAGSYQAASECGGDWWFYSAMDNRIFLWIGDVTGHGVSAALVTSAARAAVSGIERRPNISLTEAMTILNQAVIDASNGQKFMSFLIVSIDMRNGDCKFCSAGHELPLLFRPGKAGDTAKNSVSYLPVLQTSSLLGQDEYAIFTEDSITLLPGDKIFLYTDGVTELYNPDEVQWGDSRVREAVLDCAQKTSEPINFISTFNEKINDFKQDALLQDDVTFFIFNFKDYDPTPLKLRTRQTILSTI